VTTLAAAMNGPQTEGMHSPQQPVLTGDFRAIFETWYPAIYQHLYYLVQHRETAEDLAQEVFIQLYRTGTGQVRNLKAWLYTTASNTAYNYFRAEKRRLRREEKQLMEAHRQAQISAQATPDESLMEKESVQYWHRLLAQLPERDHLSLLLRAAGYSYQEIAQVLEVDADYVGVILSRAKSRLKKIHLASGKGEQT